MRRIAYLAFHYPPIGGAGVQRNVQLTARLPALGYRPLVVTGPGAPAYRWTRRTRRYWPVTRSWTCVGSPGPEPVHGARWEGRLERWLRVPPRWQRWWERGATAAVDSLPEPVELVHASLRPYSAAGAAIDIARRLGRPLIVDLEDPWALDEMMVYPTRLHRRLELRRMGHVLAAADAVVMNTEEAAHRVLETFPRLPGTLVRAIPNAFDSRAFAEAAPARSDGRFRLVHTGSMHVDAGRRHREAGSIRRALGGSVDGVDFLPRSHVFLIEALDRVFAARPELRGLVELQFAGVLTPSERDDLERTASTVVHGFLPHPETVALIRSADLLFLPMHDLPTGRRATIVPHKTYEYVASGRPILAAVPDGDARDLLAACGTAHLCRPTDVAAMAAILERELDRWRGGIRPPDSDAAVVARCEADRLAGDIAELYDEVLARGTR